MLVAVLSVTTGVPGGLGKARNRKKKKKKEKITTHLLHSNTLINKLYGNARIMYLLKV
jgi:hypothetical protein